jgi:hypothetical protein
MSDRIAWFLWLANIASAACFEQNNELCIDTTKVAGRLSGATF